MAFLPIVNAGHSSTPLPDSIPLFLAEAGQFGGAERSLLALGRFLQSHGIAHHLLTYHDRVGLTQHAGYPLQIVELSPAPGVYAKVTALRRYLRARSAKPICSGYQPALHATLAGARGFHTLMHDTPDLFSDAASRPPRIRLRLALSNRILTYGLTSGGRTFVNSNFLAAQCRDLFRINATIEPMGGLVPTLSLQRTRPSTTLNMLSVSRVEASKRIDWLIAALATLDSTAIAPLPAPLSQLVDWHFHIAGKGPQLAALEAQANALHLAQRIHFHGFVPDAELETLYSSADLFLMPAIQGYGIPAIEALARRIPVFLHRDSGVSDLLGDTPWATVFTGGPADTTPALAVAIANALDGAAAHTPLPPLPTEATWAHNVARACGYIL